MSKLLRSSSGTKSPNWFCLLASIILVCALSTSSAFAQQKATVDDKDGSRAFQRARELASFGENEEAIKQYDKAIALNPSTERYVARGRCYQNMKEYKKAIDDFSIAIQRDTTSYASPYLHRGRCYQKLNRHKEAIADFTKGIEVEDTGLKKQSKYFSLYMWRARSYDLLGQNKQALKDYDKSLLYKGGKIDLATVKMWRAKLAAKMETPEKTR